MPNVPPGLGPTTYSVSSSTATGNPLTATASESGTSAVATTPGYFPLRSWARVRQCGKMSLAPHGSGGGQVADDGGGHRDARHAALATRHLVTSNPFRLAKPPPHLRR